MLFINPIELLGLQRMDPASMDDETIRKAKNRVLADIDLSDDGMLDYKGLKINKSDCMNAIDDLGNDGRKEIYSYLASKNLPLNDFLVTGDERFFTLFEPDGIYESAEFQKLIGPAFAYNMDRSLSKAFRGNNVNLTLAILKSQSLLNEFHSSTAFQSIRSELQERLNEIDKIKEDIKGENLKYNKSSVKEIVSLVKQYFPIDVINKLPSSFAGQTEKIAAGINYLELAIWDTYDIVDVPFELLEHLLKLNIESASKSIYEENFALAKRKNEDRIAQEQYSAELAPWLNVIAEIKSLTKKVDDKAIIPKVALAKIETMLNIADLNAMPTYGNETRNQISSALRSISLSSWNIQNDAKTALVLIRMALKVNAAPDLKTRLQQDETELTDLEKKTRGIYTCYFCDINSTDEASKLSKTIYKETERTYIPRRVQFQYIEVDIPRCSSCKDVHDNGENKFWLFTALGLVLGILIGAMIDEHYVIGGILGLAAGLSLGYYLKKSGAEQAHVKLATNSSLKNHPMLEQKMREGWTFNKPSA